MPWTPFIGACTTGTGESKSAVDVFSCVENEGRIWRNLEDSGGTGAPSAGYEHANPGKEKNESIKI